MGLSGARNKTKLSHDPNNTAWSRSTTGFGHKILASQGWKPGDYLGAENASHSDYYTAANASHIRVMLREENLGIGAQVGKGNAETFGLSMFSGLLGRLNGKSEVEVEKQQSALRDVQLSTFQAQRYGFMNFVSGGLLVGDKMEFPKSTVMMDKAAPGAGKKGLKRKADQDTSEQPESKKKMAIVDADNQSSEDDSDDNEVAAPAKKEKKRKSKVEQNDVVSTKAAAKEIRRREKAERKAAREARKASKWGADSGEKARLKIEKRARKEERRQRKEEKRRRQAAKTASSAQASTTQTSASSSDSDGTATPPVSGGFAGGRHAVRQRYIQQKRMASMDPQALKEIFMLQQPKAAS
ncbi:G-patch domain protein [Zymoseptoria brevis]|uniref:PinX1-related protein 1 n=1 Tax=Zymoseptoria brevis TaxID=1047168 RepID=A0A0F4GDW2_9PEZI|nr:G-patch domain protein [Zymoseptoria brevis]